MDIAELLRYTVEIGASDLHLKAGNVPFIRVDGSLRPTSFDSLTAIESQTFAAPLMKDLSDSSRGLVLLTGPTGTGKTTTIASVIGHINRTRRAHIVTIEDPIDVVHEDDLSIIQQREIGLDTESYAKALRHVIRQDPDVVFIGEIRDPESALSAIQAAETGHLVISTMHTIDATETINRLRDLFPP